MESVPTVRSGMAVQRFSSHAEQELATIRYWKQRSIPEKMSATAELISYAYHLKGIDIHARRSDRSIVRIQCPWG